MTGSKKQPGFGVTSTVFIILGMIISCTTDINKTESFRDIFDYYRDQENIIAFSVPPSLIGLILEQAEQDENELITLMKDLSSFRIISLKEQDTDQHIKDDMFNVINEFTIRNEFKDFFILRNSEDNIIIRIKENKEIIGEAIIMVTEEEGLTVINLRGKIEPDNITRLMNSSVIQDIEELYSR
ncbi:MAG: hypothetical protein AMS27_17535 [Bacteroides sp. SM23_62_1]|nr:MAG: hypothetical protein AMS27_17535 [Bacteroides sp. SM23_62_1]